MTDRELLEQWLRRGAVVPVTMDATRILVEAIRADGYYCVVCGKFLPEDEYGVIVHADVPHPVDMDFAEEEKPQ